ncbi:MAG: TetR/AcrR family transcriptional regulator [Lachnospiraceae bacterium]|jgi:AcrR family transcriptional regulator
MPKVAYSEEERADIRKNLIAAGLELMAKQGIQHTTIQQIYERVGISRTFFYTFFSTKEEFVVEMLYVQQPKIIAYTEKLMHDPNLSWRDAVKEFLLSCCYGEKSGIAVLTIEEQQLIFRRLSKDQERIFREKQRCLFGKILESFGIKAEPERIAVFTNLCLTVLVIRKAIPDTLPLFVPEAADKTVEIQIDAIVNTLEGFLTQ